MYFLFPVLSFLFWPVIIIGLIIFFVRRKNKKLHPSQDKKWYLQLAFSREDAVSQLFILLAFFFFGITLLAFNRDFGSPLAWQSIILFTSLLGLLGAYYLRLLYVLVFSLLGTMTWWCAQAFLWIEGMDIKPAALFVGLFFLALLFYSLGHLHEWQMKFKRFALVYLIFGIIITTLFLFLFSTNFGIGFIEEISTGKSFFLSWQLTSLLFILLLSVLGVSFFSTFKKLQSPFELAGVLLLLCLFGVIAFLPEQSVFVQKGYYYSNKELTKTGIVWALVFNLAIFFQVLALIFSGYFRRETWLINLGAVFLFLLIIVKYFDWFFDFLDKSVFFIGAGILLFVVGWFMEKSRRYMILSIKGGSPD